MMKESLPSIEKMMELAEKDPDALEKIRIDAVEALIANAPEQYKRRLRGLQFEIDCERRLHTTPLGACIGISTMMLDSVSRLNSALHGQHPAQGKTTAVKPAEPIPFPKADKVVELEI